MGNNWYDLGNTKFPSVSLNKSLLEEAMTLAGFKVLDVETLNRKTSFDSKPADHDGVFFIIGQKEAIDI